MIKSLYYEFAKKEVSSIDEIDCLIEEYKNIKKISIPNTCALIFSFASLLLVTITSLFSTQASLQGALYSKLVDLYTLDPTADLEDFGDFGFSQIMELVGKALGYLVVGCLIVAIGIWAYNHFNQKRLSGFYQYKRELLRNKG